MEMLEYKTQLSAELKSIYSVARARLRPGEHWLHGPPHWLRVARNAKLLAQQTKGADETIAQIFGLLHDCERINDGTDPEHGPRAAAFAMTLSKEQKLPLDARQLSILTFACERHDLGEVSDDPTIGVCWDADRLELTRVGITPDVRFFSTAAAKRLLINK